MYNAGIILQGQNPSMFDGFQQGQQVGRQNALANLYKTQGAGIANGDQNALNALAQFDPQAALGMRAKQFDFQQAQENAKRAAAEHAAKMSAAEAAKAAEEIKRAVAGGMAAQTPEQWDAFVAPIAPDLVGQFGNREMIAQSYMSVADVMEQRAKAGDAQTKGAPDNYMWNEPGNPSAGVSLIPGIDNSPEWRDATPDEAARYGAAYGQINTKTGQFQAVNAPRGMTMESDGKGGFRFVEGAGVGQAGAAPGQNPGATNTPRDDGKLATKLSENDAAALATAQQAASAASALESTATQLETLAPKVGYTGPGGSIYGAVDDAVGFLPGDSGARGAFKSLGLEAQLSFTEKTKGAITDHEMATFKSAVPGLGQRPEANKAISQVMRAGAARVQTRNNFLEAWARKYGSLEGSEAVWQEFMRENPIISGDGQGITVNPDGDWRSYLSRKPAMSYTPQAIMSLSAEELAQIPIEQMTDAQLNAIEQRFGQIEAGQ